MVSGTGPFVLEEDQPRGAAVFIREIDPHPVLGGTLLVRLIEHLDPGSRLRVNIYSGAALLSSDRRAAADIGPHIG